MVLSGPVRQVTDCFCRIQLPFIFSFYSTLQKKSEKTQKITEMLKNSWHEPPRLDFSHSGGVWEGAQGPLVPIPTFHKPPALPWGSPHPALCMCQQQGSVCQRHCTAQEPSPEPITQRVLWPCHRSSLTAAGWNMHWLAAMQCCCGFGFFFLLAWGLCSVSVSFHSNESLCFASWQT